MQETLKQLDKMLNEYLVKKAPPLPENVKEFIVKYGPWIVLVLGILALPAILAAFGLGALFGGMAFSVGFRVGLNYQLTMLLALVQTVIQFAAIPGLLKRQMAGWNLVFYGTLLGGVVSLLSFNILGLLIGTGLGLYILYQIKSYYK